MAKVLWVIAAVVAVPLTAYALAETLLASTFGGSATPARVALAVSALLIIGLALSAHRVFPRR